MRNTDTKDQQVMVINIDKNRGISKKNDCDKNNNLLDELSYINNPLDKKESN